MAALVDRPGHVRRVPQDVAKALLRLTQFRVEPSVGHGDGRVVGEALEDGQLVAVVSCEVTWVIASVPRTRPPEVRSGATAMLRMCIRSALSVSPGSCGMRGSDA